MANRTFNNVKLNLTLKTTSTRANLSSSSEDLAVQMGKIQKWFNDFSWAVWNAPFGDVYGPGNAVTSFSVTGPDDTDDPTLVGKISAYKGDTFIPRHGMADIGVLSLGLPVSGGRFGSIWATDIHNESSMTDYQTPLMIYRPQRSEMDIDEGEARGDIQIGYGFANEISQYALYGMNLYRSTNSTTYHHVGSTIISAGYKQYYVEIDGKWRIDAIGNKTISVVIPGSSDSIGDFNSDTYAAVWNSVYNGFTDPPSLYYNEYKDFGADTQFLISGVSFKVTSTSEACGPYTYNNKDYIYATNSPGIIFSSGYNFGMLQIATSVDDHGHFPEGAAPPGTLIIAGGEPSNDSGVPVGTPIEEKHPDFAWGIHGTSGTVYDLDTINTDTKVTQTAMANISAYTNYRPLVISKASYANKSFTPSTTTAETYISPNIYCRPSSGIIYAAGRGFTQFAIQTDATVKQSAVDFETLMTWLLTNKYIPTGEAAHVILETTWSYADNDYLLLTVDDTNYQIFLAGCTIEFIGYAAAYNNGVFRFIIHTAPAKASVTPASGYTLLDTAQVLEYWFNGTNYNPRWKIYATTSDIGSAGSVTQPVYFSNGKPIAVTQPTSGAWWSSVPKIDSSGVLEIGKYIDFHATATSTNNYDYRIYISATTALFQASNVDSTQITLTSGGYTSLRFDTSASGKASSAAIIQAYPLTTSGEVMLMQSGGNTVIGAGEFATNAYARKDSTGTNAVGYDNLATAENEDLYLGADADVHIIAKGQNIGTYSNTDHKEWLFNASGELNCPTGSSIVVPRSGGGGVMLHDQGLKIQVPNSTGFARAIQLYRGNWTTLLGSIGFYGSGSATADDVEYYMGNDYTNPWYSFKKTAFTINTDVKFQVLSNQVKITDTNDAGWSLIYKSSVSTMAGQVISCYPTESQYGTGLIIGETTGGLTIIGGGEAANALNNTIRDASTTPYGSALSYQSEALIMGADSDLYFVAGANSLTTSAHTEGTNLKTFIWSNAGTLRPWNDDTYSIGASTKRWNYGYFTNISGKLIGTIDSTTTGVTQNVLSSIDSSTKIATTQFAWRLKHRAGTFYNSSTSWSSAPWGNVANVKYSSTSNLYLTTVFLITSNYQSAVARSGMGILFVQFYATNTALVNYRLKWIYSDDIINNDTVVITYTADTSTSTPFSEIGIWVKCALARYQSIAVSEIHEMNLSQYVGSSTWNLYGLTSGAASYPSGSNVTRMMPEAANEDQPLIYESASAATTSVTCTIPDLFNKWKMVYVCIQDMSFGSTATNAMNINFTVPLTYLRRKSRCYVLTTSQPSDWSTAYTSYYTYNSTQNTYTAVSGSSAPTWKADTYYKPGLTTANPGFYVGEGYNPSNTGSSSATRLLVQHFSDRTIKFTHATGAKVGYVRIYGIS